LRLRLPDRRQPCLVPRDLGRHVHPVGQFTPVGLKTPHGSTTAKVVDYSPKPCVALRRLLDDGGLPIDNNWVEKRIRPISLGRQNWLFAGRTGAPSCPCSTPQGSLGAL